MQLADVVPELQVIALGVNALLVFIIVPLRQAIKELSDSDRILADRIRDLELKVAENYVQRGELGVQLSAISTKLDRIEARLSARMDTLEVNKADK